MASENAYDRFLTERGVRILGCDELLLSRGDALAAVALARNGGVAILGGDVWVRRQGKIEPAYANWHCDRQKGEAHSMYAQRTWRESEEYLRCYPVSVDGEVLFALVTDGDQTP